MPRLPLVAVVVTFAALGFASTASAAKTVVSHIGEFRAGIISGAGSTGGLFSRPGGVAVNETGAGGVPAGTLYVVDGANNRVQQFGPTQGFVRAWGWAVKDGEAEFEVCNIAPACRAGSAGGGAGQLSNPRGVAVDQATGVVYVTDQNNRRVDVFSATGVFEGAFGWGARDGSAAFQLCTLVSGCHAPNTTTATGGQAGKFGVQIGYPAVAANGDVYVADKTNRRIDVFTPTFTGGAVSSVAFLRAFGWGAETGAAEFQVCTVTCHAPAAAGSGLGQFGINSPSDVALDSSGDIYAVDAANGRIEKFDPTPAPLDGAFGGAALTSIFGAGKLLNVATDEADRVFVSGAREAEEGRLAVEELDPAGAEIDRLGIDSTLSAQSAESSGLAIARASLGGNVYIGFAETEGQVVLILNEPPTVAPVIDHTGTSADFEGEVVSNGFEVEFHFEYSIDGKTWTSLPAETIAAGAVSGKAPVSQQAEGLTGSQLYHVRLVQLRPLGGGRAVSSETTFTTDAAAPAVTGTTADGITDTKATLRAMLDAQNEPTEYRFEYGDQGPCDANPCSSTAEFTAPAAAGPRPVATQVSGLKPSTVYFFRLVAVNAGGTTAGEGALLTTYPDQTPETDCPNQSLRTDFSAALPDCRAYELVSPGSSGGHSPTYQSENGEAQAFPTWLASPNGESVLFKTRLGALPGSEGSGVSDLYDAQRGSDGWSSALIGPSGTISESPLPGGFSSDHEYGFFAFTGRRGSLDGPGKSGGAGYLRTPDGHFEPIGRGALGDDTETALGFRITPGGTHIVFGSEAHLEEQTPAAGNEAIYDRSANGPTHVVSLLPGNAVASTPAFFQGMSADGSVSLFSTESPTIEGASKLYARVDDAETLEIADGSAGLVTPAGVSADGDAVFYVQNGDIFSFDTVTHAQTQITAVGDAVPVNISDDGSHVYFISTSQIGGEGMPGAPNLYVWRRAGSATTLVATVAESDLGAAFVPGLARWTSDVASGVFEPSNGPLNETSRATRDGGIFVFQSSAKLTSYENAGHIEIYRYEDGGSLECISCNPTTLPAVADASLATPSNHFSIGLPDNQIAVIPNLSDDGRRVFFESDEALTPGDVDGVKDVYEWDAGRISLISSGHSTGPNYIYGATPDGHDVFFWTTDTLLPRDHNAGSGSIYDARVDGGFAEPIESTPCQEDACQGPAGSAPSTPPGASAALVGAGNVRPARRRCRSVKAGARHRRSARCGRHHRKRRRHHVKSSRRPVR